MKKHYRLGIALLFVLLIQQTAIVQAESLCPFSADVCQKIINLAQNIKDNSSFTRTGINISPNTECCIKTTGADGLEKLYFDVGETVYFGMQDGTEQQWGYLGGQDAPNYFGPGRFNYTIGFSTEGSYLDDSCHAKLGILTNPINYSNFYYWVDQDIDCDNYQEYYGGNPTGQLWNYSGNYSYATPGLKVITSIALPVFYTNATFTVPLTFKIIAVGDEYRPVTSNFAWLIPVINLIEKNRIKGDGVNLPQV